jgi:hypothetical protein
MLSATTAVEAVGGGAGGGVCACAHPFVINGIVTAANNPSQVLVFIRFLV